ncbi:MAG: gamma-glutamylcyclotransferase [Arenicellales bacterium]|jgi:cation transport protein ChaC|nr:gamma-glutamylcyclotransferase [Arenicellales bacterium]
MKRFDHLTTRERGQSLQRTIELAPDPETISLFAYGSLIWRPCFEVQSRCKAILHGYRRDFCVFTVEARGAPDTPGLGLGLRVDSASCQGVLIPLPEDGRSEALTSIWEREMLTAVYQPKWVSVEVDSKITTALTFVVDELHPQCAGDLSEEAQAVMIGSAVGELGSCRDYLVNTIDALRNVGIHDLPLEGLLRRVNLQISE